MSGQCAGFVEGANLHQARPPIRRRIARLGVPFVVLLVVPNALRMIGAVIAGIEHVLIHPPHPRRSAAPASARHPPAIASLAKLRYLQHAAARPVQIGSLVEDDVDHRRLEHAEPAHRLRAGNTRHAPSSADRSPDLPPPAAPARDSSVTTITCTSDRSGIASMLLFDRRPDAGGDDHRGEQQDQKLVANRKLDDFCNHATVPALAAQTISACLTIQTRACVQKVQTRGFCGAALRTDRRWRTERASMGSATPICGDLEPRIARMGADEFEFSKLSRSYPR